MSQITPMNLKSFLLLIIYLGIYAPIWGVLLAIFIQTLKNHDYGFAFLIAIVLGPLLLLVLACSRYSMFVKGQKLVVASFPQYISFSLAQVANVTIEKKHIIVEKNNGAVKEISFLFPPKYYIDTKSCRERIPGLKL